MLTVAGVVGRSVDDDLGAGRPAGSGVELVLGLGEAARHAGAADVVGRSEGDGDRGVVPEGVGTGGDGGREGSRRKERP